MEGRIKDFLVELQALLQKHNASFGGCTCCGSTYGEVKGTKFENLNMGPHKFRIKVSHTSYSGSDVEKAFSS